MSDLAAVTDALHFAALKHRAQRRKDGARTPYVNHVIAVVDTLSSIGGNHRSRRPHGRGIA